MGLLDSLLNPIQDVQENDPRAIQGINSLNAVTQKTDSPAAGFLGSFFSQRMAGQLGQAQQQNKDLIQKTSLEFQSILNEDKPVEEKLTDAIALGTRAIQMGGGAENQQLTNGIKFMIGELQTQLKNRQEAEAAGFDFKKDSLKMVQDLRKEFNALPKVKEFQVQFDNFNRIDQAWNRILKMKKDGFGEKEQRSPAAQAIITSFNKLLDPGSVVRESEFGRVELGQGWFDRWKARLDAITKGGQGVSIDELQEIRNLSEELLARAKVDYDQKREFYVNEASRFGIQPASIVGPEYKFRTGLTNFPEAPGTPERQAQQGILDDETAYQKYLATISQPGSGIVSQPKNNTGVIG